MRVVDTSPEPDDQLPLSRRNPLSTRRKATTKEECIFDEMLQKINEELDIIKLFRTTHLIAVIS